MTDKMETQGVYRRRVIGLALSGGGARGFAHVGVLKVLEGEGVPIDLLAGTSMGGVLAALYAAGLSAADLEAEALHMARPRNLIRLVDLHRPRDGLLSGDGVRSYLEERLGRGLTFDRLSIPLGLVAVDLISGQEVILREGAVADAVRATSAFPAVFEPVEVGEYRLVDGGVLNNLPADVVRHMGAEVVIAVNVGMDFYDLELVDDPSTPATTRIAHNAWRAQSLTSATLVRQRLEQARPDVLLHPHIPGDISAFRGFNRAGEIIAAGEEAAARSLDRIRRLMRPGLRLRPRAWSSVRP
jgi:NTE family protein